MKYICYGLCAIALPLFSFAVNIDNYYVDIVVHDNAEISVTEQVSYNFGQEQTDSITHNVPLRYATDEGKRQSMELSRAQVTINDQPGLVIVNDDARSADIVISSATGPLPNQSEIVLTYMLDGAIQYHDNHNQIVWNPLTSNYQSPIDQFAGSIQIPREFAMLSPLCRIIRNDAEYGCNISPRNEGGYKSFYAHTGLQANDVVNIESRFNTGVEVTIRSVGWTWWEWGLFLAGIIVVAVLVVVLVLYAIYKLLLPEDKQRYYSQKYKGKPTVE